MHYKKNSNGVLKHHKRDYIYTFIDEYYQVEYWFAKGGPPTIQWPYIYSPIGHSRIKADRNSYQVNKVIDYRTGKICCSEFGRSHNWSRNKNEKQWGNNWLNSDYHVLDWKY